MPRRRNQTRSVPFREEAVRQARESRKPLTQLADDLGVKYSTLRLWVKEAEAPPEEHLSDGERSELRRLRKEVRELRATTALDAWLLRPERFRGQASSLRLTLKTVSTKTGQFHFCGTS
jgi:transposase-like protein